MDRRSSTPPATRRSTSAVLAAACCCVAAFAANSTFANGAAETSRYALTGTGTLALDAPAQSAGSLQVKATLQPIGARSGGPMLQSAERFALSATLSAATLVCYGDTIFRDDFDADGF